MDATDDSIKSRMDRRLDQLHWSLTDLANATEESYRNVHRWIREDVKVPAHFIARFARVVPVNPRWLLSGDGTADPVKVSEAERALQRIAHVLDSVRLTRSTGLLVESVIDSSFDGILAYDQELCFTVWNRSMERITGVSAADAVGREVLDVFPNLAGTEPEARIRGTLRGEGGMLRERPYAVPSSQRSGWYEARYSPLRDGAGEIVGGVCVFREVSDRRRTMLLREEAEERHRSLLELCGEPAFVQSEGTLVEASSSLADLAGCAAPGELVGMRLGDLLLSDNGGPSPTETLSAMDPGERVGPLGARLSRRDGSVVEIELVATGVRFLARPAAQALVRRKAS